MRINVPKKPGVYRITCNANGKVYIGSAACMYTRLHVHKHQLLKGTHHNRYLQRAWNKHGNGEFSVDVLTVYHGEHLTDREQFWMDLFRSYDRDRGFNLTQEAGSSSGVKRSEEYLLAMAERKAKKWILTGPDSGRIEVSNLAAYCRKHKLNECMLRRVARGLVRHWQGWTCWPAQMTEAYWKSTLPKENDTKFKPSRWVVTPPSGRPVNVVGLRAFCEKHGLHTGAMHEVANGKRTHHKGWTCRKEVTHAARTLEPQLARS